MNASLATLDIDGAVATLTLNDPARLNALSRELLARCNELLDRVRAEPKVRALVVRAEGRSFCCGADLSAFQPAPSAPHGGEAFQSPGEQVFALMRDEGDRWVTGLRSMPIPVLCAVQGAVAGGGVGFALAADLVVAARSAYFYLPFVPALGLVPDMASLRFMARAAGEARAVGAALLGEKVSAERAAQWGLVWACVDDDRLAAEAAALAQRLAALPRGAITEIRELLRLSREASLPEQLEHERQRQRALMDGPDFPEGVRAFLERRPPRFHP